MTWLCGLPRRAKGEDGQLSLLVLGFTVIALTLVIGGAAVTSVHISRMRLLDAADTAALDAADEDVAGVYASGIDDVVPVAQLVDRLADEYEQAKGDLLAVLGEAQA